MSFLDDTKNFGLVVTIIGAIGLIASIATLFMEGAVLLTSVGYILSNLVMLAVGYIIYSQNDAGKLAFMFPKGASSKFGVLTAYIFASGVSNVVSINANIVSWIIAIIIGLIIIFIAKTMADGKKSAIDSIIWILLVLIFGVITVLAFFGIFGAITLLVAAFSLTTIVTLVEVICGFVLGLIAFTYLLDSEVKNQLV